MSPNDPVTITLRGGRITSGLREVIYDAANRAGVSVNELVLTAAAERLAEQGKQFPGVFSPGDLDRLGSAR